MTNLRDAPAGNASSPGPGGRGPLIRWLVAAATLNVPQASGPVAFALVALEVTGEANGGAAMVGAMTLAQVAGALPITRLGTNWPAVTFLRLLVAFRTAALIVTALLAQAGAPLPWLILFAALAGSVNGAAYGFLRTLLNHLAPASGLPRALGIAATLNEVVFVLGPVVASGLGAVSPVFAVLALALLGAAPALLVPDVPVAHVDEVPHGGRSVISPPILLWLACAAAGGSAIAAIEIGAVALALRFGYEPTLAILFTVPLCIASVSGGIWVSVRNRMASRGAVLAQLSVMTAGMALAALGSSLATTVAGAILIGSVVAPLATHYALVLDVLAPPRHRPEVFALLRTANAIGVIFASALLTAAPLSVALVVVTGTMIVVTMVVAVGDRRG